jgi:hypothetical protein
VRRAALLAGLVLLSVAFASGDRKGMFLLPDKDSPAIEYATRPTTDAVSQLALKIQQGKVHLKFDEQHGYLRSVLEELEVPVESQLVVFSKTSFQMYRISPDNPRSLYFNDSVAVGWVRGGPIVELAAEDPTQGVNRWTSRSSSGTTTPAWRATKEASRGRGSKACIRRRTGCRSRSWASLEPRTRVLSSSGGAAGT